MLAATNSTAQTTTPPAESPASSASGESKNRKTNLNGRIFGVLPNYRTTNQTAQYQPLTVKQKFYIGYKDSTDYPVFLVSGAFSLLSQIEDQNPSFGEGMVGYAKRYGGALVDQSVGNMLTESIYPVLLHEDPRYFRRGEGSKLYRTGYALSRIFICKNDHGRNTFNFAEVVGNATAVAISNSYYPDTRDTLDNLRRLNVQILTDAFSNVLKEFWPDIKRRWFTRHPALNSASVP